MTDGNERLTTTDRGHELVAWIGHLWHDEGVIDRDTALEIRAAVVDIEGEATAKERARLTEFLRHTWDAHGYPCPASITMREFKAGLRCICGLDEPKRNLLRQALTPDAFAGEL